MNSLPDVLIEPIVRAALAEDLGRAGDITSRACIAPDARLAGAFGARSAGVIAGLACARLAVNLLDPHARFEVVIDDGGTAPAGAVLARVDANARALLGAERVALNLLCRLSGVATLTAVYVAKVAKTGARIVDTRKTTPGLRALEKYAVRCGGGANHRFGLDDAILIKETTSPPAAAWDQRCGAHARPSATWSRSRWRSIASPSCARPSNTGPT